MKAKIHFKQISPTLWDVFLTNEEIETFKTRVMTEMPPTKNDMIKLFESSKERFDRVY